VLRFVEQLVIVRVLSRGALSNLATATPSVKLFAFEQTVSLRAAVNNPWLSRRCRTVHGVHGRSKVITAPLSQ